MNMFSNSNTFKKFLIFAFYHLSFSWAKYFLQNSIETVSTGSALEKLYSKNFAEFIACKSSGLDSVFVR